MTAGREGQELGAEVRIPRRRNRYVESIDRHAAADRLATHRLVTSGRELLPVHVGFVSSGLFLEKRSDTRSNLPGFLGPIQRLPLSHKATPLTNPNISTRLAAP